MNPKLRFANRNKDFPKKDEQGNRVCRFCRKPLAKGVYCSKRCHEEVDVRCGFNLRGYMRERDKSICVDCGINTRELNAALQKLLCKLKFQYYSSGKGTRFTKTNESMKLFWDILKQCGLGHSFKTTEEFHHIVAVEAGGGCCGLDNLVTLCARCHKKRHSVRRTK